MITRRLGIYVVFAALASSSLSFGQSAKRPNDAKGERASASAATADANEIVLSVGETKTISARDVKNYSEGVAGIIDVRLTSDASQFVLVGKRPGATTLLLIKTDGSQTALTVNVFTRSPALVEKELAELLVGLNVRSRRVGAQIVLDGVVADEAELKRVQTITALYPDQVISLVQTSGPSAINRRVTVRRIGPLLNGGTASLPPPPPGTAPPR
jgi:pilus assembly protein CpaC